MMALTGFTSRGRAFLAAGITATAGGVVLDQRDLVRVGVLLLALPVAAAIFLTRAHYRISAQRRLDRGRASVGAVVRVEVQLHNLSRLTTPLLLAEDALPPQLGGGERRRRAFSDQSHPGGWPRPVSYAIRPVQRGRYVIGPLSVRLADPFGFCQLVRTFATSDGLSVLPAVVTLPPGRLGGQWSAGGDTRQRGITTSGEQDVTTRPYLAGDDRRLVHWRTTARTGELAVRREEQPWQSRATLLIDTRADAHIVGEPSPSFEFAISLTASITAALIRAGYGVRLVDDIARILAESTQTPGEAGYAVMETLADLTLKDGATLLPVASHLGGLAGDLQQGGSVIAVLGSLTPGDAAAMARAARSGARCLAVLLDVDAWMGGWPGPAPTPISTNHSILAHAGWNVAIAGPQTPIEAVWQQLNSTGPQSLRRWVG